MPTPLDGALEKLPLIAVLRGITPEEALPVGEALAEAGFSMVEATMNSPDPIETIRRLAAGFGERLLVGAGTVLDTEEVRAVAGVGGRLIVSPNLSVAVVRETRALGLVSVPGVFTPTEAFAAIEAGASALKLFPAEAIPPGVVKAWKAVLPPAVPVLVTGGVTVENLADYAAAGAAGAGIGSALYRPGKPLARIAEDARRFADAWRAMAVRAGG